MAFNENDEFLEGDDDEPMYVIEGAMDDSHESNDNFGNSDFEADIDADEDDEGEGEDDGTNPYDRMMPKTEAPPQTSMDPMVAELMRQQQETNRLLAERMAAIGQTPAQAPQQQQQQQQQQQEVFDPLAGLDPETRAAVEERNPWLSGLIANTAEHIADAKVKALEAKYAELEARASQNTAQSIANNFNASVMSQLKQDIPDADAFVNSNLYRHLMDAPNDDGSVTLREQLNIHYAQGNAQGAARLIASAHRKATGGKTKRQSTTAYTPGASFVNPGAQTGKRNGPKSPDRGSIDAQRLALDQKLKNGEISTARHQEEDRALLAKKLFG